MNAGHDDKVRETFDAWAANGRSEGMERGHGPAAREAFSALGLPRGCRYLDVGCGNGYTLRWAASELEAVEALGLDLSPKMVERARALSREHRAIRCEAGSFPEAAKGLKPDHFDGAFSMEALYYLPSLGPALLRMCELLRPGGRFACVVDYYLENPASHSWPEDLGVPMILLPEKGWAEAFRGAGFEIEDQRRLRPDQDPSAPQWKTSCGSLLTLGRKPER